jgi:hypothetical protein
VVDERGLADGSTSAADRELAGTAADLARRYLVREIERAGVFAEVLEDAPGAAGLELLARVDAFAGDTAGTLTAPTGRGQCALAVRVTRAADGAVLLETRYVHEVTESRVLLREPDPLGLACAALKLAVDELLLDLDRLDPQGPAPAAAAGG